MDGSLSHSRYGSADRGDNNNNNYNSNYRGGGGGGGGRRFNNNSNHRVRDRNNRRQQPYNNNNRRHHNNNSNHRGPRTPGNRFGGNTTTAVDPATAVQRQLAAMVSRVGELRDPPAGGFADHQSQSHRPVMQAVSKNISDLASVLCSQSNAPIFLKFQATTTEDAPAPAAISPKDAAGPLAALLVNCAATLPLQTPAYVGLTLSVEQQAPQPDFGGFGQRCVTFTMHVLSQLLQSVLTTGVVSATTASEMQHLLRYLVLLGKANLVVGHENTNMNEENDDAFTTISGLLHLMAQAAMKANASAGVSVLLRNCVWSVLPYALDYIPSEVIADILSSLSMIEYQSSFAPGLGSHALLLQKPQHEEGLLEEDDNEEEEDDEEEDASEQVCDTMQDLMRCVKAMVEGGKTTTRYALLTDAPYKPMETPCTIKLPSCPALIGILNDGANVSERGALCDVEGRAVFGRLPIFGSPPDDDDDDDDEEGDMEDEDIKNEALQTYEKAYSLLDRYFFADAIRHCLIHHQSTVTDTGVTRGSAKDTAQQIWSIGYMIRPAVNDESVVKEEPGINIKEESDINMKEEPDINGAATTTPAENDDTKGFEYILIETLLSLLLQASSTNAALSPLYLSRVLLELVRAHPAVIPQALAVGVHNLFEFYLPSLVPLCRDNLSSWLALHLTNTDYQWPKSYWDHWAKYVSTNKRNCRGDFVTLALELMVENLSSTGTMVSTCLPPNSTLATSLYLIQGGEAAGERGQGDDDTAMTAPTTLEANLLDLVWNKGEDPDVVESYISQVVTSEEPQDGVIRAIMLALLHPMELHRQRQTKQLKDAIAAEIAAAPPDATATASEDNANDTTMDPLVVMTDAIVQYQGSIRVALEHDKNGASALLKTLYNVTSKSEALLEGCLQCLFIHDIVNTATFIKWLLGDSGGTSGPCRQWYRLAISAFSMGLKQTKKKLEEEAMVMVDATGGDDNNNSDWNLKVTALGNFAAPHFRDVLEQVCQGLEAAAGGAGEEGSKGLKPTQVDLVEGVKQYILQSRIELEKVLKSLDNTTKQGKTTVAQLLVDNDITGESLARLVRDHGSSSSNGIELLGSILERM